MIVALHARKYSSKTAGYIQEVIDGLMAAGSEVMLLPTLEAKRDQLHFARPPLPYTQEALHSCDALFCVGGDGTILEAVTYVRDADVPILGINVGRLGFLAYTAKNRIQDAISLFLSGKYTYERRSLLALMGEQAAFADFPFALNEFVIFRRDISSVIGVTCYVDDYSVGKLWADGLMVSTPTGSTAYSLSCGGPVSTPSCKNFIITPISPHNLSVRSLIVPDSSVLTFEVDSIARRLLVSLDARFANVPSTARFSVQKATFSIRLIQLESTHFFHTLREKMGWGADIRK